MGEVGAVIPEKQSESPATVNGDVNGLCKLKDDQMDVDTEEDSQVSSENGISEVSQDNTISKLPVISKSESLSVVPVVSVTNLDDDAEDASMHSEENENSKDDEEEDEEDEESSRHNQTIADENSQESSGEEKSQDSVKEDENLQENSNEEVHAIEDENSRENTIEDDNSRENAIDEENSQSSNHSNKSKDDAVKENGVVAAPDTEQSQSDIIDDVESPSSVSKEVAPEEKTKENGELNGSVNKTAVTNISDDITIIESDDDDEPPPPPSNLLPIPNQNKSGLMISCVQENVEQMEVDSTTNGTAVDVKTKPKPQEVEDDDDAPVIIPSDSDSEIDEPPKPQKNSSISKPNDSPAKQSQEDEDLSDKDDCVVIEDDDKKEKQDEPIRRTPNRQRKSIVRTREIDDDDDIAEIVDDTPAGQPPSKRARTTNSPASISMGQIGTITIKDARSLMGPFVDISTKQSFQQQFAAQTVGTKGTKEAPGLVIIDSNSLLKPGLSPQNAAKQLGIMQVGGVPAQGLYPNNIRPSLAPLSTPPKLVPTSPAINLPISNPTLLPALTDDMFVLEAPSFIVPYIYEKPPPDNLKEVVAKIQAEIDKIKQQLKESDDAIKKEAKQEADDSKPSEDSTSKGNENSEKKDDGKSGRRKKKPVNGNESPDESWDEGDASTDDEASDGEAQTKVLIKEAKPDLDTLKSVITSETIAAKTSPTVLVDDKKNPIKVENYFESPLGKFYIDIGINLVQEYVQTDLLRIQKRKQSRVGQPTPEIQLAIKSLQKNIETSKQRNEPFKFDIKRCEFCNFKSESALAMAHHYETPHMRQYLYKCNFCSFEIRPPHDILFHMEAVHNIKGRLEKALGYHQCPNCPFEENGKSKFARHVPVCAKKFRPEVNLQPPHDWEAPAKIPRIKPRHGLVGTATAYQAMAAQAAAQKAQLAAMAARATTPMNTGANRNRGRPQQTATRISPATANVMRGNQQMRPQIPGMVLPNSYQISGGQLIQVAGSSLAVLPNSHSTLTLQQQQQQNVKKASGQQPSISITPLPRQPGNASNAAGLSVTAAMPAKPPAGMKPGQVPTSGKASFVICEICDGYIKDLEQLRNHMQWMHKVKIHPKMIYNRPPLNCQKCQFRFFTDQGLERHLLGSHGLVTSSMQEAANKGKDAGRCPVCGRMYQWKLLNHVSRDHHMTLKPAHLSYKCTVCTATFGMYKQFENHVYTAHSTVAKKAMDGKKNTSGSNSNNPMPSGSSSSGGGSSKSGGPTLSSLSGGDSLLKPLKINDEITIIPQPATKSRGSSAHDYESHILGKSSNKR